MDHARTFKVPFVLFAVILCLCRVGLAGPVGTAFTYQGRLLDANQAADGLYDFQFKLYDADSNGSQLGPDVNLPEVDVIDGYFMAGLDFGDAFDGNERWLDIGVRPGDLNDPNTYTVLSPRHEITPTPYAIRDLTGETLWQVNGTSIYYNNGNVGIGTSTPGSKLTVEGGTIWATTDDYGGVFNATGGYGIGVTGYASGISVYGVAGNNSDYTNFGGYFQAAGATGRGVFGYANHTGNYTNYGGYFWAGGSYGIGVYGWGNGYDFYAAGSGVDYGASSSI